MKASDGRGLGEWLTAWRQVTAEIGIRSGLAKATRRKNLGNLLSMAWGDYGGATIAEAPIDIIDQLYMCAFNFIKLAGKLEDIPPVHSITIGNIPSEADVTLSLLKDVAVLDEVLIHYSASDGTTKYETVRPPETLQGILVKRARDLGMSWKRIGDALGMSAQGIQQKAQDRGWTPITFTYDN